MTAPGRPITGGRGKTKMPPNGGGLPYTILAGGAVNEAPGADAKRIRPDLSTDRRTRRAIAIQDRRKNGNQIPVVGDKREK
jgi:hypothetical protein